MRQTIDRAVAKSELERINEALSEPHLLIGGLAVQQYHTARNSKDIDLVCDFKTAQLLLDKLYPSRDWRIAETNEDDYRPSYEITNKSQDTETICFGPKISEREPYQHIDWDHLKTTASPFKTKNRTLQNILVPDVNALGYTKFISFICRNGLEAKNRADLQDFVNLTNHENFSPSKFFNLLRRSKSDKELTKLFHTKSRKFATILSESILCDISKFIFTELPESKTDVHLTSSPSTDKGNQEGTRYVAWEEIVSILNSMHRKIESNFKPDLILTMSGPGSVAASYCMSINLRNPPILTAVTFPASSSKSGQSAFHKLAAKGRWHRLDTAKWVVFLPNILETLPSASSRKLLLFDDRVISGETQRAVAALLTGKGFEVRRAAMVAPSSMKKEVHFIGINMEEEYYLPWGPKYGRY